MRETPPEPPVAATLSSGSPNTLQPALPKAMYVDPEHFARERDRVLFDSWFCVGRLADLGLDRPITVPEISSPGLVLSGFTARFAGKRMHVLGETEIAYLRSLRGPLEFATFAADDPMPALLRVPARLYSFCKGVFSPRRFRSCASRNTPGAGEKTDEPQSSPTPSAGSQNSSRLLHS